jgi:hypothetical protein
LFNFYENSYFWYLKRFYLFNTLPSNFIKSKLNLNLSSNLKQNNNNLIYNNFLSLFLKSNYTNLSNYSHFYDNKLNNDSFYFSSNSNNINYLKDFYLLTNENEILNKDNLNLLY